jgi:tetratricopeptide (TPR) repeat protein
MATVSLQAIYDEARRLLEGGDAVRAIGMAQHMLAYYPDYLEAYRILGEAYLADRQVESATEAFSRVLRADPENIPAHVGLGIAFERAAKPDAAIAKFETALEIKPDLAELRSQLLRLYTDTYGSENAQLRLSRAGLARLYVKGHMLPQAIQEFRAVVAEQPQRLDTRVALAEALWRDGQAEAAVDVAGQTLREFPEALKPNLIVGYNLLSSGEPGGEPFWNKAHALDPYMGVARTLFETLPDADDTQPSLPEWDEQAWLEQQAQLRRDEQAALAVDPAPALAAIPTAGEAALDDELFGAAWLGDTDRSVGAPEREGPPPVSPADDDFLAALLGAQTPAMPEPAPSEAADLPPAAIAPFSLDDLDSAAAAPREAQPFSLDDLEQTEQPARSLTPFSLDDDDFGLDMTPEALPLQADQAAEQLATALPPAEPGPAAPPPFSLDELDADDEPVPLSLQELGLEETPAPATEPELTPFSLSDLGLTDEEISLLGGASTTADLPPAQPEPTADANMPAELKPFSLDELDLDFGGEAATGGSAGLPQSLQPFSLDDPALASLDEPPQQDEPIALPPLPTDEEAQQQGVYSWSEPSSRLGTNFARPQSEETQPAGEESIFSKLMQRRKSDESAQPEPQSPAPVADHELDMSLFSHDDVPLREDAPEPALPPAGAAALGAAALAAGLAAGQQQEAAQSATSQQAATPESAEATRATGDEEPELVPFSLAELGLSDDEIAALGLGEAGTSSPSPSEAPPSQAPTMAAPAPAPSPPAPADAAPPPATEEPELMPFSLAELGLNDDEFAPLELDESLSDEAVPAEDSSGLGLSFEEIEAFDFGDFDLPAEQPAASQSLAPAPAPEPAAEPFDFSGLDSLSEMDAIADNAADADADTEAFDLRGLDNVGNTADYAEPAAPLPADLDIDDVGAALAEGTLQPFSLADLGLSPEEIAALGLDETPANTPEETPLTSFANNVDLPPSDASQFDDPSLTRLLELGRRQAYVDINDIIAEVTDPVAEADRIEAIGQQLHEAGIQIRDGDEIIDMDEVEYADDEFGADAGEDEDFSSALDVPADRAAASEQSEPELTPFSLAELGLSEDEIAMLGLEEQGATAEAAVELPREIFGEPTAADQPAPTQSDAPAEPELVPFSLEDLGLTPDEIAMLSSEATELGESSAAPSQPQPEHDIAPQAETVSDDLQVSLDSLSSLDEVPPMPALSKAQTSEAAAPARSSALSAEDKSALIEKKDLVSNMLADLRGSAERREPVMPPPAEEPPLETAETFETLVPAIDEPPSPSKPSPVRSDQQKLRAAPADLREGASVLDEYLKQLKAESENDVIRLAVARLGSQVDRRDVTADQYRMLIKRGALLDQVVDDLVDLIGDTSDHEFLRKLHRLLGDAYAKQGRYQQAINEYSWTLTRT